MLFIPQDSTSNSTSSLIDSATLINLQTLSSRLAQTGLVCSSELTQSRPDWESWIIGEATRRTVYAMYLFDNVFNAMNGMPSFVGEELEDLPAPAEKVLWEARDRGIWEREYNAFLARWEGGGLKLGELWPRIEGDEDDGDGERKDRVERWVGDVDEFGMMLYAVVVHTYGEGLTQ
jgi:hypothetical protein